MTEMSPIRAGALFAAVFIGTVLTTGLAVAAPDIGKPAPDFSVADTRGKTHKLSDYRGRTVILEWTNHGCPYVRRHYDSGNMQALQKETTDRGVVWLSVISSSPGMQGHVDGPQADALTEGRKASPTAVFLDPTGEVGRLYHARTTPHMYVIDPQGSLVYQGAIDDRPWASLAETVTADNYVRKALARMAEGKPVDPAVTRAYGCSVKYGS